MNENEPPVEARAPFDPQPADLGGCGKPTVIGCLVLLVVLAIGLVIFLAKARSMLDWALVQYQEVVMENLSDEVTEAERRRLEEAFEGARAAIREDRMDPRALQDLQRIMSSPPKPNEPIEPETVRDLTEALEAVAKPRVELPAPESGAAPAPLSMAALHHAGV